MHGARGYAPDSGWQAAERSARGARVPIASTSRPTRAPPSRAPPAGRSAEYGDGRRRRERELDATRRRRVSRSGLVSPEKSHSARPRPRFSFHHAEPAARVRSEPLQRDARRARPRPPAPVSGSLVSSTWMRSGIASTSRSAPSARAARRRAPGDAGEERAPELLARLPDGGVAAARAERGAGRGRDRGIGVERPVRERRRARAALAAGGDRCERLAGLREGWLGAPKGSALRRRGDSGGGRRVTRRRRRARARLAGARPRVAARAGAGGGRAGSWRARRRRRGSGRARLAAGAAAGAGAPAGAARRRFFRSRMIRSNAAPTVERKRSRSPSRRAETGASPLSAYRMQTGRSRRSTG